MRRRRVLGLAAAGLGGTVLSGCARPAESAPLPVDDLVRPLLLEAVTLADAYGKAVVTRPDLAGLLAPLGADHRRHAKDLAMVLGVEIPTGHSAIGVGQLRSAEQAAQRTAADICRRAPIEQVELVGSIAACRAAHAEALR